MKKFGDLLPESSRKAHRNMFKAAAKKKHDADEQAAREKRLKAKGWVKNDRGGMSKVETTVEIEEGRNDVVKALADKAKTGGIDKADFKKAHDLYKAAKLQDLKKLIKGLDTDVAEYIADVISRHDSKAFNSMYPKAKSGDHLAKIIREDAQDEKRMMRQQLMFMAYAAKEIAAYLDRINDPEEWYQNKMATTHSMMKTLYSYAQGQMQAMAADRDDIMAGYYGEETMKIDGRRKEFREKLRKLAYEKYGKKKVDAIDKEEKNEAYRKPTPAEIAKDKAKDKKSGNRYKDMKKKVYGNMMGGLKEESDSEEFQQEIDMVAKMIKKGEHERLAKMIKRDAKSKRGGGWNMAQKPSKKQKDQYNKMIRDHKKKYRDLYASYNEEVELDEANFKPGSLKLKDGSKVKISMDDAKAITAVMKTLNPKNRKEMETRLMADKKGFDEIMAFVQAAGI
jgi:hypothetical protein